MIRISVFLEHVFKLSLTIYNTSENEYMLYGCLFCPFLFALYVQPDLSLASTDCVSYISIHYDGNQQTASSHSHLNLAVLIFQLDHLLGVSAETHSRRLMGHSELVRTRCKADVLSHTEVSFQNTEALTVNDSWSNDLWIPFLSLQLYTCSHFFPCIIMTLIII